MTNIEPATDQQVVDRLRAGLEDRAAGDGGPRGRLVALAARAGLLDVAYRTVESPFGPLLVASTSRGLVRIAFEAENHQVVLERLAATVSPRVLRAPERLDQEARQLEEYFAGRRRRFDIVIDLQLVGGFRHSVLSQLDEIPYGATDSYSSVARRAGRPSAVRAAASACSHNPLPIVVPCHRVIRNDGTLGGYLAGLGAKRALLDLEKAGGR